MRSPIFIQFVGFLAALLFLPISVNAADIVGPATTVTQPASGSLAVGGDLTDLTFTATGSLTSALVSPKDGSSVRPSTSLEVSTVSGAGVEIVVNGEVVPFSHIGQRMVSKSTGETHFIYYGLAFRPGANDVAIAAIGAGGTRGATTHVTLFGAGDAVLLQAGVRGSDSIHVLLLDQWHHAALPQIVRATVLSGDVTLGDRSVSTVAPGTRPSLSGKALLPAPTASPSATSSRVPMSVTRFDARSEDDGTVDIPLMPGLMSGDAVIRVNTDNGLTTTVHYFVQPQLRAPIVVGLVTGGLGSLPGVPGEGLDSLNGVDAKRGRAAIFGSGSVFGKALLTFAYNTSDTLDQTTSFGSFIANPDERPYQTYGDASTRRDDSQSQDHLYTRLEEGNTSLMWGEFQARTGSDIQGSIGGLDMLVNGAKFETGSAKSGLTVFNARNDITYGRQTFTPTGLATLQVTLHPDIVVGSDIVDLVALDRHTGAVVSEQTLTANVDYVLDDGTGYIRFINVPMPFDQNFNPQQVLIRYQYRGAGNTAETTGGRVSTTIGSAGRVQVGAGYANSAQGSGNVALLSEFVTGKIGVGAWSVEHMATRGDLGTSDPFESSSSTGFGGSGDAWRVLLATALGANKFGVHFDTTSAGYDNPFGGLATPGLLSYRGTFSRAIAGGSIDASFGRDRNVGVGFQNAQSNAQIAVKKRLGRKLTTGVTITHRKYEAGSSFVGVPAAGQSINAVPTPVPVAQVSSLAVSSAYANPNGSLTQLGLNVGYKFSPAIDLQLSRLIDLASSVDAVTSDPSQTTAELGVSVAKKGRAYIREMWNGGPDQSFAASSVPLTAQTQGTRSTAIGFERSLGNATSIDSEYVLQNSAAGSDVYSAIGVKQEFMLRKHLKGALHVQKANAVGSGLSGFNVYDVSAAYTNAAFKATSAYELRTGDVPGTTLSVGVSGSLSRSVSVIASLADANTAGFTSNADRVSVAYRPSLNDDAVALFGYDRESGNDTELGDRTQTLSIEQLVRPRRTLEFSSRFAYKLDGDTYYAAHTYLLGLRATQRLGGPNGRFDISANGRYLGAGGGIVGQDAFGYAVESGATIGNAMRLGVGYNFAAAPDPNLSVAAHRKGVYVTFASAVDSIFGWGKR